MALRLEQVDGASFAPEASSLLKEAWANQPSMEYSPEYVAWQLSFPGPIPPVAVAAFDGAEPVGFVAATVRRLRLDSNETDGFVASFWCMRPGRGGPLGPLLLLENLVKKLRSFDTPVLVFGLHDGRGERLFPPIYARAGFLATGLGSLPTYAFLVRSDQTASDWIVTESDSTAVLSELVSQCASKDPTLLYLSPDSAQLDHYSGDPRARRLLVATDTKTGSRAAAWAIRASFRNAGGVVSSAPTLDSVILERSRADALPALLRAAAEPGSTATAHSVVVNAPSLAGFNAEALQSFGVRQVSSGFQGHLYLPPSRTDWQSAKGTASEII
jgi:hypothetical protein